MYKIIGHQERTIKNLGGKGFNLLKLDKSGFTPNFLIISSSIFDDYIQKDCLLFKHLSNFPCGINLKFTRNRILQFKPDKNFLVKINKILVSLNINKLIIRSSFISEDSKKLSYAGLFESYCCSKKSDIFRYIKKVWASQFTERVFNYQKEKKDFKYGMAVIIQDFIQPDFSGVVFLQKNKFEEILIEYGEKTYRAIELGTKKPFVYLLRDNFPYLSSSVSKSHSHWLQNLIDQVLKYKKENNISFDLDIEFAILKNKVYLLQARPLTKKIDIDGIFFIFEREKRWNYHLDDFSIPEFKKILKKCNLIVPYLIEKRDEGVFILAKSYFFFIDGLKNKSTNLKILNDFYKYFLEFIFLQSKKAKKIPNELISIIFFLKKLNFKMSILDYLHNLFIKDLKEFLTKKYSFKENRDWEYFVLSPSFGVQKFLLNYNYKRNQIFYDQETLAHFNKYFNKNHLNSLARNIKITQKKIEKKFSRLKGKKKRYFSILKKLIWLRDVVDYYYDEITCFYGDVLDSIFKKENIKYPFENSLKICQISLSEILAMRENKFPSFSIAFPERKINYSFPLKGIVASKGNFTGIAKIIKKSFSDIKKITPQDILIAKYTRPALVAGMAICKGIITEEGGLTSHAAIVSRELEKPCLINVDGCTEAIKDGDRIKVINGKIYKA